MIKDIRMIHSDGDYLLLETESGEKYRLLIDDATRQAIKRETPLRLDESTLSPRDIQEAVRAGKSAEQIVAETGENADYVTKFAAPVLDELAWVLENAQSVRLVVAEDKFHDPTFASFGEIIAERIHNRGAESFDWSIRRTETNQWLVAASYSISDSPTTATWVFDPHQATLEPQNAVAVDLSANRGEPAGAKSVIKPVVQKAAEPKIASAAPAAVSDTVSDAPASTNEPKDSARPVTASREPSSPTEEKDSPRPALNFSTETAMPDVEPSGGLVDEIKRRREKSIAAAAEDVEAIEATQELPSLEALELADDLASKDAEEKPEAIETAEPTAPTPKKGRSSIPSWDEIVFGTKTDEPETL